MRACPRTLGPRGPRRGAGVSRMPMPQWLHRQFAIAAAASPASRSWAAAVCQPWPRLPSVMRRAHAPLRKAAAGLYSRAGRPGVGVPDDRSSSSGELIRALEYRAVGIAKVGSAAVSPAGAKAYIDRRSRAASRASVCLHDPNAGPARQTGVPSQRFPASSGVVPVNPHGPVRFFDGGVVGAAPSPPRGPPKQCRRGVVARTPLGAGVGRRDMLAAPRRARLAHPWPQ